MRRQIIILSMLLCAVSVSAQDVRVGECGYWCQMFGGARDPIRRVEPSYLLPKTVGVAQIAYSGAWYSYQKSMPHHLTTLELFDELAYHGIRAVRLWLTVPYWDGIKPRYDGCGNEITGVIFEDMRLVWEHPYVDTIVLILTDAGHTSYETDCDGSGSMTWLNAPIKDFATFMFENFGDQDKTIILANTEIDNQWRGFKCTEPDEINFDSFWGPARQEECLAENTIKECVLEMAKIRYDYAIRKVEEGQRIVEEVRDRYPNAKLRLETSMTISAFAPTERLLGMYALSAVRDMEYPPDRIGVSHWKGSNITLTEAIEIVKMVSGYSIERLFVDQIGQNEKTYGRQYTTITRKAHEAWDAGVTLVMVWLWRTTWPIPPEKDKGMWSQLCIPPIPWCGWGESNSGLQAIYELNKGD